MTTEEFIKAIRTGEINVNQQQLFFSTLLKGLLYDLNRHLKIRGKNIPHYIVNTGDDIMYLEVKNEDHSIEPLQNSNESFVYTSVPRCTVTTEGISVQTDQLTSPYTKGNFQIENGDILQGITAEYRRTPVTTSVTLNYILDSFTDCLDLTQQILSSLVFIRNFNIIYLGQTINCSYTIPDSQSMEKNVEFDGISTDTKTKSINFDIEIATNLPVIYNATVMSSDRYITTTMFNREVEWTHQKPGIVLTKGNSKEMTSWVDS
jgi:hypothetical protein